MFSDSFHSSPTKLLFILIESVRNGGKNPLMMSSPTPSTLLSQIGTQSLVSSPTLTSEPTRALWPGLGDLDEEEPLPV